MPIPGYTAAAGDRRDHRAPAGRPGRRPRRRARRDRPRRPRPPVRRRCADAAAHPAAQPVGPGLHAGRARGHPRRRTTPRRPRRLRRDPRAARPRGLDAPRPLPVPRRHRRSRGGGGRGVQGVQHPGPQVRADHRAGPGHQRPAPRRPMARNDSWSPLGVVAAVAAYTECDDWLDALRARLSSQRDLLVDLLAEHLPEARMRPLEATYLAWIDLRRLRPRRPRRGRARERPGPALPGPRLPARPARPRPAQHRHQPRPAHRDRAPDGEGARSRAMRRCSRCLSGWPRSRSAYHSNDRFLVRCWVTWSTCTSPNRFRDSPRPTRSRP